LKSIPFKAPLHSWQLPERPWQRLHIDHAGPFIGQHFLILVDAHSEFSFVVMVSKQSSRTTIDALWEIFGTIDLPEQIVSDNGGAYISEEFDRF